MGNDDLIQESVREVPEENVMFEAQDEQAQEQQQDQEQEQEQEQDQTQAWEPDLQGPTTIALEPLGQIPLELTLRCGKLILTLGELRRLAPGSVLEVSDTVPGHATLCHGERVVAEGELVDVNGRLGLQLTRMASLI